MSESFSGDGEFEQPHRASAATASGHRWVILVTLVVLAGMAGMACTSSAPEDVSSGVLDGGMRGLEAEEYAFWKEWTPEEPARMTVDNRLEPVTVFETRRIDDPSFRHRGWDGVFHVLRTLAMDVDDETRRGLESLMLRLDAGVEGVEWEVAFVSQGDGEYEGIVYRIVASDGAGIWLEASRPGGGTKAPTQWSLRTEPAARDVDGMTVVWAATDDGWERGIASGADVRDVELSTVGDDRWERLLEMWEETLWEPVSDRAYLQPEFEYVEDDETPLADGWPAALGEEVEQRGLGDFARDTVFPPGTQTDGLDGLE